MPVAEFATLIARDIDEKALTPPSLETAGA
jgi:hypothetical protein